MNEDMLLFGNAKSPPSFKEMGWARVMPPNEWRSEADLFDADSAAFSRHEKFWKSSLSAKSQPKVWNMERRRPEDGGGCLREALSYILIFTNNGATTVMDDILISIPLQTFCCTQRHFESIKEGIET